MFEERLSTSDKIEFFDSLSVLFNAGVPLLEALENLGGESSNKRLRKIVQRTTFFIKEGQPLSTSLSRFPEFGSIHINLVRSGEATGKLPEALANIVSMERRGQELKEKVISAMIYPAIVLVVMFLILSMIFFFVMPRVGKIFRNLHVQLPFTTEILLWISDTINRNLIVTAAVGLGIMFFTLIIFMLKPTRRLMFELLLLISVFKKLFLNADLTSMSQTMSLMLSSGIPILDVLRSSQNVVASPRIKRALKRVLGRVAEGKTLTEAFRENSKVFPSFLLQLIRMGEASGGLDSSLFKASEYYTNKVNASIKLITTLIEPALLIILAVMVGGIILSIMAPMYQIISQVSKR